MCKTKVIKTKIKKLLYVTMREAQIQLSAKPQHLDSMPKKVTGKHLTDSSRSRSDSPWSTWEFHIYINGQKLPFQHSLWEEPLYTTSVISTICASFHLDSECFSEFLGFWSVKWGWKYSESIPRLMEFPSLFHNEKKKEKKGMLDLMHFTVIYFPCQHSWPPLSYFDVSEGWVYTPYHVAHQRLWAHLNRNAWTPNSDLGEDRKKRKKQPEAQTYIRFMWWKLIIKSECITIIVYICVLRNLLSSESNKRRNWSLTATTVFNLFGN